MKNAIKALSGGAVLIVLAAGFLWFLNTRDEPDVSAPQMATQAVRADNAQVQRGAYLARAGNCLSCHTARGGEPYAGGRGIETPFGTVYTSNLTPDEASGIGSWSPAHFWRAMHNGRSKDGRLLYPAFPYNNFTLVTREDSDALLAYLKTVKPVSKRNQPNTLRFPYSTQAALALWRALYFSPDTYQADSRRTAEWNRGAYLVGGLGHCSACHTARNALGASQGADLAGGLIPVQNWYAPSLASPHEAGVADWERQDIVNLLKIGVSSRASVNGPMTEVVQGGTQHLSIEDLNAMAQFLKELPGPTAGSAASQEIAVMAIAPLDKAAKAPTPLMARGAKLYDEQCANCHGEDGRGQRIGAFNAYPALAGNRAVLMPQTVNLVQIVLNGGYAPATAGNPRPFGMPPFVLVLDDSDVAAVLTHIRGSWGNQASAVSPLEVNRIRARQSP